MNNISSLPSGVMYLFIHYRCTYKH